jgi:hypothetical protein
MTPEIELRVQAFRRALELAAGERASEPVPFAWHKELGHFRSVAVNWRVRLL